MSNTYMKYPFPTLLVTSPCSFQSENMSLFTTRFTLPCLEWWLLVIWTYWIHFPKFICFFFIWKYTFSNGNTFPFVKMSWLGFMKHQMRKVIKTEGRSSLLPGRVDKDAKPEWYIWLQASGGVTRICEVQRPCWDWSGIYSTEVWNNLVMLALKDRNLPSIFSEKQLYGIVSSNDSIVFSLGVI